MTLIKILKEAGHVTIGEAANGIEAFEKYKEFKPDIVLMDITMPDRDGLEATHDITTYDPNATVIMVSAMGQQEKVFAAIANGAKDFIVKPFQNDRVLDAIKRQISEGKTPSITYRGDELPIVPLPRIVTLNPLPG